jgi:tetratricopeptide (TPR) repeat protein
VALFGFKKNQPSEGDDKAPEGGFTADPAKARKWFEHGRKMASSSNFEYALTCFASAVKFDPSDMTVHEAMLEAARKFLASGGKAASSKDVKQIDGPGPIDRFAAAEFVWMRDLNNLSAAMKLLEATAKAGQDAFGAWLSPMVMNMLRAQKKPTKSMFVQAKDRFSSIGAWNEAFLAGEEAVRLDPSDTELIAELKQLTAQRAITQGGYAEAAEAGEGGGFRTFVKDMDKQRELEAAESISGTADSQQIAVEKARKDLAANPASPEAVSKLGQLLRRTGQSEDEEAARTVYLEAYERLNEYRFKAAAADIDLARLRREVRAAEERVSGGGGDEANSALADAEQRLLEREQTEFTERVEKYPTDRRLKLDLGRVLVKLERFEDAMACFQECKDEPKFRVESAHMLGLCFARSGWHPEAVSEFREAIENIDATERDRELSIRYDLMLSLIALAKEQRSLENAREAAEICSQIIRKNISFRDIRERRKEIDTITKDLAPPA